MSLAKHRLLTSFTNTKQIKAWTLYMQKESGDNPSPRLFMRKKGGELFGWTQPTNNPLLYQERVVKCMSLAKHALLYEVHQNKKKNKETVQTVSVW